MKRRIVFDGLIMFSFIALTAVLFQFPHLYFVNKFFDSVLDVLGLLMLLTGIVFRMSARGHKKRISQQGKGLVTTGLYQFIRNPMYLGTYFIGGGFLLIVWPWWSFPLYSFLFFLRFRGHVLKEEYLLAKTFGESYNEYCREVPSLLPEFKWWKKTSPQYDFCWQELWSTKEKRLLLILPALGFLLEILQQKFLFGMLNINQTFFVFSLSIGVFLFSLLFIFAKMKMTKQYL